MTELELRATVERFPKFEVKWHKDNPCGYPHVDIRFSNGSRAVGWVVPDGLEDRLPSVFDGMTLPPNPYLPPETEGDEK